MNARARTAANRLSVVSGSALLTGSAFVAGVLGLLLTPLLTRAFSPAHWGPFAVLTAILGIAGSAAAFRYEQAIPLPGADEDAGALTRLALLIASTVALLSLAIVSVVSAAGMRWPGDPVEWALPPGILLVASGLVAAAWRLRRQQYLPVAVARLLRIAGAGAAQLLLVLFFPPSAALLAIGALIGFAAETAVLAGVGWLRGLMPPAGVWSRLREVGGRFSRFPTTVLPAAFGGSARDSLVPILLSTFATADIVGAYWLADRVMLVPVSMLSQSVATVLFAQLSADRREDESGTEAADMRLVIRPATVIFILGVVPAVLVAIAGPVAFPLIFGAEWVEAGQLARAVAPRALLWACAFPVLPVFITHGRERLLLGWQFGSLFVLAAAIAVGAAWGSLAAVWSYSIASAAMSVVAIVLATRVCGVAWSAMPAAFAQEARWTFRTLRALPRWRP